ncbi:ABC transporter ATP-binding protein [Rapidithrix thailandica]|uniref:ABC transporter ATP-binding protein n=1 Tax=Rapidithrix thailandica TaxID=413964 RepID=A0AAW9S581_9BACT
MTIRHQTITPGKLLKVKNLSVKFHAEKSSPPALKNINLELGQSETIAIVGESGSGKTLTALSILQLINQKAAKVQGELYYQSSSFGEVDLLSLNDSQMKKIRGGEISMIFQDPTSALNPVLTCGKQVNEMFETHFQLISTEARKRTLELFRKVQLAHPSQVYSAYPHQLSGGQQQRVMIAMAVACKPKLILADEPTTALDVTTQKSILALLQNLCQEQGTSIVFITHDLAVAAHIAERIIVTYQGEIVEKGSVWDVFSKPKHPYTKGLLACRPRLDFNLSKLPTLNDFLQVDGQRQVVKYTHVFESLRPNLQSSKEKSIKAQVLSSQEPLLEVCHLTTVYQKKRGFLHKVKQLKAVDDISFKIYPNETLGIVGESGCGKTTLGKSILRLVQAHSGNVKYQGIDLMRLSSRAMRKYRKDLQIIFQDPISSLNPRIPIGEAIMEPMKVHNIGKNEHDRRGKAMELLEAVHLNPDYFYRFPHEFSGGQRQRISIARTLAVQPKFIICDESVSALDVSVQAQVLNLLNELKNKYDLTYLFISHDMSVIKFIADRVIVMHQGKVVEENYTEPLFTNPQADYTRKLIQSIPSGDLLEVKKTLFERNLQKSFRQTTSFQQANKRFPASVKIEK